VAERAELGEQREAMLAVEIPEQPGSLRRFCRLLGQRSLTEFSYRLADPRLAHIFVGVQTQGPADTAALIVSLEQAGFGCLDLSGNELAKLHLRHMVGGRLPASAGSALVLGQPAGQLEHQHFSLPQPRSRRRPHRGGGAGAPGGTGAMARVPGEPGLPLLG
jgi:hypothetical protein